MKDICNCLLGKTNGSINDIISKNKEEWKQAFSDYRKEKLEGGAKERDIGSQKLISSYTIANINEFLETDKGLYYRGKKKDQFGNLVDKKLFEYDEFGETAFERNYDKYRDYQRRIIENWSVSAQELLILYYIYINEKIF